MKSLLVLIALVGSVAAQTLGCNSDYAYIANHTICRERSPAFKSGGVSAVDIQSIVDKHNNYRKNPLPPAIPSTMQKLHWDDRMATLAQKLAESCKFEHDNSLQRKIVGFGIMMGGQNMAKGYASWAATIDAWFSEGKNFKYGQMPTGVVSNYTEIVYEDTARVGCGFADCSTLGKFYICNYANGHVNNRTVKPFKIAAAKACEGCPNNCVDGLCECGGRMCENNGVLDVPTCNCTCSSLYWGDSCNKVVCTKPDGPYCGVGKSYPPSFCKIYPGDCPWMCNLCKAAAVV